MMKRRMRRQPVTTSSVQTAPGSLLKYLPEIYAGSLQYYDGADAAFLGQMLAIFDPIWRPLDKQIGKLDRFLDPLTTREDFLPWLATWVNLTFDDSWPEDPAERTRIQRELIRQAASLYEWRGTRRGLGDYLKIYLGKRPMIVDDEVPFHFTVLIQPGSTNVDLAHLRQIIRAEKPAHTTFSLRVQEA